MLTPKTGLFMYVFSKDLEWVWLINIGHYFMLKIIKVIFFKLRFTRISHGYVSEHFGSEKSTKLDYICRFLLCRLWTLSHETISVWMPRKSLGTTKRALTKRVHLALISFHPTEAQCCQIFLGPNIPKRENIPYDRKLYQTAINYTKWPKNIQNGHKI
jgi:hypothetical protein